jgi:hypothetical protein
MLHSYACGSSGKRNTMDMKLSYFLCCYLVNCSAVFLLLTENLDFSDFIFIVFIVVPNYIALFSRMLR